MISSDKDVEPIVPLGYLGGALGYSIKWSGGSMTLNHPEKGEVIVKIIIGCPQVEKKVALDMIKEIEKGRRIEKPSWTSTTRRRSGFRIWWRRTRS